MNYHSLRMCEHCHEVREPFTSLSRCPQSALVEFQREGMKLSSKCVPEYRFAKVNPRPFNCSQRRIQDHFQLKSKGVVSDAFLSASYQQCA